MMLLLGCGGGETVQVVGWLLLVRNGKWAVRLMERDVVTGMWSGESVQVVWLVIVSVRWKVGSEVTGA